MKPLACTGCPSRETNQGFAHGEGNTKAAIVFIGEALGETEASLGRPFVGGTGRMLRAMISQAGIPHGDFYITNVVKCRPPGNRTPTKAEVTCCTERYLWAELADISPELIVPVGDTALYTVLPTAPAGITSVRGSLFWNPDLRCKVLPIVHPSYVARGNPEYWGITVRDLKKAWAEAQSCEYVDPMSGLELNIDPSLSDILSITQAILQHDTAFAFDLETVGERWGLNIMDFGFAWSKNQAMCVSLLKRGGHTVWSEGEEEQIWQAIMDLMASPNLKIGQNIFTFDIPKLMELGVRVEPPAVDTLVKHHTVAMELPHSLEFLASVYADLPHYKKSIKGFGGMLWIPDELRRRYNCLDTIATYRANYELDLEIEELGLV